MASGKIVYNSITLSVPRIVAVTHGLVQERSDNWSASGKHEAINIREYEEIAVSLRNLAMSEAYAFWAFWSWARLGNPFALAVNAARDESTTLDGAAAAGQKNVPLTSTSGFAAEDWCLIKEASGDDYEVIQIDSVDAGVKIVSETNLIYTYASADIFRHVDYWPTVVVKDTVLRFDRGSPPGKLFSVGFTILEVK